MAQSRSLPAGDVFRARLILLLAEGVPYRTIQERLNTTAPTIVRWKGRFLKQRIEGLTEIRHPGQKPVSTAPGVPGDAGVSATLTNPGGAAATVTVKNYPSNPTTANVFDAGGGFVDLRVSGADSTDTVAGMF